MKEDQIRCSCCRGTGKVPVTGVYAETLHGLRRMTRARGYVVANRDAGWFLCEPTALNNRLAWLEKNGLAKSEKFGRQRRFVAVT